MFAVIKTGGKQYKVAANDVLKVEKLEGEAGDTVTFEDVLMVGGEGSDLTIGAPLVDGALVAAELVETRKDKTVIVFKKNRRHNYRRRNGHRQLLSTVRITEILTGGKKPSQAKKAAKPATEDKAAAAPAESVSDAKAETKAKPAAKKADAKPEAEAVEAKPVKKAPAKKTAAKADDAGEKKAPAKKAAPKKAASKSEDK